MEIAERIKDIRVGLNLNQKGFADKIGSTVSALSNWENGRNKPNDLMLKSIADVGNVSIGYLLTGQQNDSITIPLDDYLHLKEIEKKYNQMKELMKWLQKA